MNWYDNRDNLVELWQFLDQLGYTPEMPLYIEKPWKWDEEWKFYQRYSEKWQEFTDEQVEEVRDLFYSNFVAD